jgi:hypothetical protein
MLLTVGSCDTGSLTRSPDHDPSAEIPGPPKDPGSGSSSGGPEAIVIDGPSVVTLSPADTLRLHATPVDSSGAPVVLVVEPSWSSEIGERVEVDEHGLLRAGSRPGHSWVFVEADEVRDSVGVWIQPPESTPSTFGITLYYGQGIPAWWTPALEAAAERWERTIRAALPAVTVAGLADYCGHLASRPPELMAGRESGVRIFIRVSDAFPVVGAPRATAGVCASRGLPKPTSVIGLITLNAASLGDGPPEDLAYLAHHEMGHALGLVGTVLGDQPAWLDRHLGTYSGHLALFGRALDGQGESSVIEFGPDGHWSFADLMGTTRANAISHATIGALMDLGYPAAWYGSGPIEE